jgi:hypothetical protein
VDLKKLEGYLNDEPSKKAVTEVMKLLKLEDILAKVKERRIVNRLMGEPMDPKTPITQAVQQQRKDPRLRE